MSIGQEAADRAERALDAVGPEGIASMFTEWAAGKGILARVTEAQCADLAAAFGAGFARGLGHMTGVSVARESVARERDGHLWPCGCLRNDAGAHRVGCPDHPEGVRG